MGRQTSIDKLPQEVRAWLERALTENNFSGYAEFESLLNQKGYQISKSALHRYGQKMERRLSTIKASTLAARLAVEGAPDDANVRSEAVIAIIQSELFESLINLQEAAENEASPLERIELLSKIAKNTAGFTNASINQKKYKADVAAKAAQVAEKAQKIAEQGGLSAEAAADIRRAILGIST